MSEVTPSTDDPPQEGDEEKTLEKALPETVVVDGKQVSRKEILDKIKDYSNLQATLTQNQQQLSEARGQVQLLNDQATRTVVPPTEEAPKMRDFAAEISALDRFDDNYDKNLTGLIKAQQEEHEKDFTNRLDERLQKQDTEVNGKIAVSERIRRIDAMNVESIDRVLKKFPISISDEEKGLIKAARDSLYSDQYVKHDPTSDRYIWYDEAVETAMHMVPTVREKLQAKSVDAARTEGIAARVAGERATRSSPSGRAASESAAGKTLQEVNADMEGMSIKAQTDFIKKNPELANEIREYRLGRLDEEE